MVKTTYRETIIVFSEYCVKITYMCITLACTAYIIMIVCNRVVSICLTDCPREKLVYMYKSANMHWSSL